MKLRLPSRVSCGLIAVASSVGVSRLCAQNRALPHPVLSLSAGAATNNIRGVRTGFSGVLRIDLRMDPLVIAELGMGYLRLPGTDGRDYRFLLPEVSFQGEAPLPLARPFVGLGIGWAERMGSSGASQLIPSLHAVLGARIGITPRWVARGEVRVRTLDPAGKASEWTLGLGRRL